MISPLVYLTLSIVSVEDGHEFVIWRVLRVLESVWPSHVLTSVSTTIVNVLANCPSFITCEFEDGDELVLPWSQVPFIGRRNVNVFWATLYLCTCKVHCRALSVISISLSTQTAFYHRVLLLAGMVYGISQILLLNQGPLSSAYSQCIGYNIIC